MPYSEYASSLVHARACCALLLRLIRQVDAVVLCNGVRPPMDTPLLWLSNHCSAVDGFLYLTVHTNSAVGLVASDRGARGA